MEKQILQQLETIEQQYGISILLACETGSRAWGFPSPDSDYDVRFIYMHKPGWYLNSCKVRLKGKMCSVPHFFLFHFNSCKVRLKVVTTLSTMLPISYFNSCKVRLKGSTTTILITG